MSGHVVSWSCDDSTASQWTLKMWQDMGPRDKCASSGILVYFHDSNLGGREMNELFYLADCPTNALLQSQKWLRGRTALG